MPPGYGGKTSGRAPRRSAQGEETEPVTVEAMSGVARSSNDVCVGGPAEVVPSHLDRVEPDGGEPVFETGGVHRAVDVVIVQCLEFDTGDAVVGDEHAAGPQHPSCLGEEPIL